MSKTADRTADAVMVVGTASNSGKSLVAAALCRYFARKGRNVAPFKAQNMALNSFVTPEGGEMGRAQVAQATAAGIVPHTDMNPVLLKPVGDGKSQVIANGKPVSNMSAREYYAEKDRFGQMAREAYDRLKKDYDLIVLEGAGSPSEINLADDDFVNMRMAEHAGASVILVADIDRGGVFASILGTVSLLPAHQRKLLRGVIINKFRGDVSLLDPGIVQIEEMTGMPVLGVLPFIDDFYFEEEDSLGLERRGTGVSHLLDIAVIRFPRISNYTDFLALETTPGVRVRYVSAKGMLGTPDLIVLPGSKNTLADLRFLREKRLLEAVVGLSRSGTPVMGICGGYQMLGDTVNDPDGVEGAPAEEKGMGLLPVTTILQKTKELAQVSGHATASCPFANEGTPFTGYEIHAGETVAEGGSNAPLRVTRRRDTDCDEPSGAISRNGMVFGSYIHGLLDGQNLRRQLLDWLCATKGIDPGDMLVEQEADLGSVCDMLADLLAEHVDMDTIEGWL